MSNVIAAATFALVPNPSTIAVGNLVKTYLFQSSLAQIVLPFDSDVRIRRISVHPRFVQFGNLESNNLNKIGLWNFTMYARLFDLSGNFIPGPKPSFISDSFFCSWAVINSIGIFFSTAKPFFEPVCVYASRLQVNQLFIYSQDFMDLNLGPSCTLNLQCEFLFEIDD